MFRKIIIVFFAILFVTGVAFSGQLERFVCDKCGFKSGSLAEGLGRLGIRQTIVYCRACKDFFAIPTERVFGEADIEGAKIIKPIGKKIFLGKRRLVYPCPKCGSKAIDYSGPLCPICKKSRLKVENIGFWD